MLQIPPVTDSTAPTDHERPQLSARVNLRLSSSDIEPDLTLDPAVCLRALRSRDPRFDGRFFPGVATTRVYCRTICPVPLRKPQNIRWFATAAAAEAAGFRPCRRCNPNISPGTPAWYGTAAVVSRALKIILDGGLSSGDIERLSDRVGIGPRHLRRLFVQHLGASPLRIAQTWRAQSARDLIAQSNLPIAEVAFRSGFKSIRQFNQVMRDSFDCTPSQLRRAPAHQRGGLLLHLAYRPPLDWPSLIAFLRLRATPGVEHVQTDCYRRTIDIDGDIGEIEVTPDIHQPRLQVRVRLKRYVQLVKVVERVRRLFDLFSDPVQISRHLSSDVLLREKVKSSSGLRVPGAWDGFEVAVKVLLGESLTNAARAEPVAKLVQAFGRASRFSAQLTHLFPSPETLAQADLSCAGIRGATAVAIRELAQSVMRKRISFEAPYLSNKSASRLMEIPGVDKATADYIAMRAPGEPDSFPFDESDLSALLTRLDARRLSEKSLNTDQWRPWRAYALMHLRRVETKLLHDPRD